MAKKAIIDLRDERTVEALGIEEGELQEFIHSIERRRAIAEVEKSARELGEERRGIDEDGVAWIVGMVGGDGVMVRVGDESVKVTVVEGRGGGTWDKKYLSRVLTPEQMEKAFTPGKTFAYLKVQ